MIKPVKTLLCTVGTSLFGNLKRIKPEEKPEFASLKEVYEKLKSDKEDKDRHLSRIADLLIDVKPAGGEDGPQRWINGAEICSVYAMFKKKFLDVDRQRIIFLVSDTDEGRWIGRILKEYFADSRCLCRFENSEVSVIDGLQDKKPLIFRSEGLSELVRQMGKYYTSWQYSNIGINATGGYKAQIALAVAFGQVMNVSVFYKHDKFNQIISFPKVPFSINLEPIDKQYKFWADVAEPGKTLTQSEIDSYKLDNEYSETIEPLMDSDDIDGVKCYSLSALGLIYWQRYLVQNPDVKIPLDDVKESQRSKVTFRDDHYPDGFREYVKKLYDENRFVMSCHSLPYDKQKGIKHGAFYEYKENHICGEYKPDDFGARFEVVTGASNSLERRWVLRKLNEWFKNRIK